MPTSIDNLPSFLAGRDQSDNLAALNLPVFPVPERVEVNAGSRKLHQIDVDPVPTSGDDLSGFSVLPGDGNEIRTAQSLPVFPGPEVVKSTSEGGSRSEYDAVDILSNLQNATKLLPGKDRSRASGTGSCGPYEQVSVALPVFPGHGEDKSTAQYSGLEVPTELKNTQPENGRKSVAATTEDCDQVRVASRYQESVSSNSTLSPPEHRSFASSSDSATAFRAADFWPRAAPAYVNDHLFLAGAAANLRHFDVGSFSGSSEMVPTNLARRYGQPHPMMAGNIFGGVVDFRRLPVENPAVTSQQTDTPIPEASPLSLARYQRK